MTAVLALSAIGVLFAFIPFTRMLAARSRAKSAARKEAGQ